MKDLMQIKAVTTLIYGKFTAFLYFIAPGYPTSTLRQFPAEVQEGNVGHLLCESNSTTVPMTHNLTMKISWYIDGRRIDSGGRFRVAYSELNVYFMTRADNNLAVACKAQEHLGLTSWANITIQINCKLSKQTFFL